MALAANISTLTDELIAAVTKTSEKNTSRFKNLKCLVEETFKADVHGRTDQFAVANQLEGLQEKFQVLNKDDLADALRTRLNELDQQRDAWIPEILSLLLQLSDRPAQRSSVDRLDLLLKPSGSTQASLTWSELDAAGSAYCDDDIWENVDFGAGSSDDDISTVSSDVSIPRILPQSSITIEEDYVIPEDIFSSGEDEDLIASIKSNQFWKPENNPPLPHSEEDYAHRITELQVVRETIFMLQGLPTSIFWRLDDSVEIDRRYALAHSSKEALSSLLRSFSLTGVKIDALRRFVKAPQSIPYVQTFLRGIEGYLHKFDTALSGIQSQYLFQSKTASVSVLQLLEDVRRESKLLLSLSDLVSELVQQDASAQPVRCLDLLYDLVCMRQATGENEEFQFLARLFFSCLETYVRPIRLWIEAGQLDSAEGTFFVLENRKDGDLRSLWHDWFTLDEASRLLNAPKFLQPVAHKVFTTGKSLVFLRHLNVPAESLEGLTKTSLTFEQIYPEEESSSASLLCLPFSGLLETSFDKLVDANHSITSNLLRQELDQQAGLWISLQALEQIYLCKDMSVFGIIDHKIFELIDRGRGAWNDRFLLTELAQSAFSVVPFVDPSRIIVRSQPGPYRDADHRTRSVKILKSISIDYVLPWPVANIITKDAIGTYQRVSTFLMQIRRAKYIIAKQRLRTEEAQPHRGIDAEEDRNNALGYALRHNLLWFLNVLYSHMTDLVISAATDAMLKALSASKDVDAMIAAHRAYTVSLEDQCLLSKNLAPIYQAIITLLDLCVHFADIQASQHGENQFDQSNRAYGISSSNAPSSSSRARRSSRRVKRHVDVSSSDSEDRDEDDQLDDEEEDLDEGNTTTIFFAESPYASRVRNLKLQFDRLIGFVAAGLKGVGRVDGQFSWEILAEKLEWRKERLAF